MISKSFKTILRQIARLQAPIQTGELFDPFITFQFAIFFLPKPSYDPCTILDAYLKGKFAEFRKVEKIRQQDNGLQILPFYLLNAGRQYRPPDLRSLTYFGRGLNQTQSEELQKSERVFLLDFGYPKAYVWSGMRLALELAGMIAQETGGLIWDEATRLIFTHTEWIRTRITNWTEDFPDISTHIAIHQYPKKKYPRAITLGMEKFGLPDIVVEKFARTHSSSIRHLMNLFAQAIAEGAVIERTGEFELRIAGIRNKRVRERHLQDLKLNAQGYAYLSLQEGLWERGDPYNLLIEITFDQYPGPDIHAQKMSLFQALWGWDEEVMYAINDDELLAASQRAKAVLSSLKTGFNKGLQPNEKISVKVPFKLPNGSTEYMWVEVVSWSGKQIKGILANVPKMTEEWFAGQEVEVSEEDVFDYHHILPNGTEVGNETSQILKKRDDESREE